MIHQISKLDLEKGNWVKINDDSRGTCNTNSQIKFKSLMLMTTLCDYSDAYVLVRGTITITGVGNDDAVRQVDEINKRAIFKNCAPFTNCISETNNTQIDNTKYIDAVMAIYNLIEYNDNYLKTSGSLWQHYRDDPNDAKAESESFKYKIKITGKTYVDGNTKDFKIAAPLKYFWNDVNQSWN